MNGNPSINAVSKHHLPALDGLRAVAVIAVVAYHLSLAPASGGFLGVDLFFVLSGFLITSLLLEEWVATARIKLAAFWARRIRRLLPALLLVLVAIASYVVLNGRYGPPGSAGQVDLSGLRQDALATLLYVANWHAIFAHQSYFAQFAAPSPLEHTWSLAIEEQFYAVWPPILLLILTVGRRAWRKIGVVVTVAGALFSAGLMAFLYQPGADPTRLYFGTDTHMFDVLAGATVAMFAAARPQPGPQARRALHAVAPIAAGALLVFWMVGGTPGGQPRGWMFEGGFALCAVLATLVVADVRQIHLGPLGRVLSVRPLRWIGSISYGIYLWHWPIIVYLNPARTGLSAFPLDLARTSLTLLLATSSYYLVEQPFRRYRPVGWPRFSMAPIAAALTAAIVLVATIPAVATPPQLPVVASRSVAVGGTIAVAGAGGYQHQMPIELPTFGAAHPIRVTVVGDSVAQLLAPGISAALGATGEAAVANVAFPGWGLTDDRNWDSPTTGLGATLAQHRTQLVLATWSWDDRCPLIPPFPGVNFWTDNCALEHPKAYKRLIEKAVRLMLGPGGASGVIFMEFPLTGSDVQLGQPAKGPLVTINQAGERAWNAIVRSLPGVFPGKVMYLPVSSSVLLNGQFTPWLPPPTSPTAPKAQWQRIRMTDGVHLCPPGVTRYADAVLADLTTIFHLDQARPRWSDESWIRATTFTSGNCPNDHP